MGNVGSKLYEITNTEDINISNLQEALQTAKIQDVNYKGKNGSTPLLKTAWYGSAEAMALLLQHGADVDATKDHGWTALHGAAANGHPQCVVVLLEAGATVDATKDDGRTALHMAARMGHPQCVVVLLEARAKVDAASDHGRTALHLAACYGYPQCVEVLLEAGADRMAKDKDGETPLDVAKEYKYNKWEECVKILEATFPEKINEINEKQKLEEEEKIKKEQQEAAEFEKKQREENEKKKKEAEKDEEIAKLKNQLAAEQKAKDEEIEKLKQQMAKMKEEELKKKDQQQATTVTVPTPLVKLNLEDIPVLEPPFTVIEREHDNLQDPQGNSIPYLQFVAVGGVAMKECDTQIGFLVKKGPDYLRIHCNVGSIDMYKEFKKKMYPSNVAFHLVEPLASPAYCPRSAVYRIDAWPNSAYTQPQGNKPIEYAVGTVEISDAELWKLKRVGAGTTCTVHEYKYSYVQEECVVKAYLPHLLEDNSKSILRESRALRNIQHPNIVPLFAIALSTEEENYIPRGLVLQKMKCTLTKYLDQQKPAWQVVLPLLAQAAAGIVYLHEKNVLHLDIKPDNVMLDNDLHVKISDFGSAHVKSTIGSMKSAESARGTPLYLDPRYMNREEGTPDKSCDVFSFTMMMWEALHWENRVKLILSGLGDANQIPESLKKKRPEISSALPSELTEMIERCWSPNVAERRTMKDIHTFLSTFAANF